MTSVSRTGPAYHQPNNPAEAGKTRYGTNATANAPSEYLEASLRCSKRQVLLSSKISGTNKCKMQNMLKATQTMRNLLQTKQAPKQNSSYQVTEHAPTHKTTKQKVPQKPNFPALASYAYCRGSGSKVKQGLLTCLPKVAYGSYSLREVTSPQLSPTSGQVPPSL